MDETYEDMSERELEVYRAHMKAAHRLQQARVEAWEAILPKVLGGIVILFGLIAVLEWLF